MPSRVFPCSAAALVLALAASAASAQLRLARSCPAPPTWASATTAQANPAADAASAPTEFEADRLRLRIGESALAEGQVVVRRGPLTVQADRLEYRQADDTARAQGQVRIERGGDRFSGPELALRLDRYEGSFVKPTYHFGRTAAGGRADRVDFLGERRALVLGATYTSCPFDDDTEPAWELSTRRLQLDFAANEGVAEGAVLRFHGVPILGLPVMSFPLTSERKSGWLPPDIETSSTVGLQFAVPFYWNIAPNYDATLTPVYSTRRGFAAGTQLRYLRPSLDGVLDAYALPRDQVAQRERWAARLEHRGAFAPRVTYSLEGLRMSDDNYWKDGLGGPKPLAPRLLPSQAAITFGNSDASGDGVPTEGFDWGVFARAQRFQVLQDPLALIDAPYQREPQVGLRLGGQPWGLRWLLEGEFNRFTHDDPARQRGERVHATASLAYPIGNEGFTLTPRLAVNAARYDLVQPMADGRRRASRVVPGASLDAAWSLEREAVWFERAMLQTLEPRIYYVHTAYRDQGLLPNFDSAKLDFNAASVFADNAFSGVDRLSDAHQITAGLTTRLIDRGSGAEAGRFSVAQRYLLRDQRVTLDEPPLTQRFSDVLLAGSTTLVPRWAFDSTVQYGAEISRIQRSVSSVRYFPGPYRTVSTTYRYQRGQSEQVELAWQWPLAGLRVDALAAALPGAASAPRHAAPECAGTWYGVGRADYNLVERRLAGGFLGIEYDGGCWIGRLVVERQSTSASQATTRVMWQLELVGLSRLGTNPLRVLKDNIPGYQRLRSDPAQSVRGNAP